MKMEVNAERLNRIVSIMAEYPLMCYVCPAGKDGVKCPFNCEDDPWLCKTALWRWLKGEQLK